MTTNTKTTALDQFLWDVFVTALEGGIGYWSECTKYHPWETKVGPGELREDYRHFEAVILVDAELLDDAQAAKGLRRYALDYKGDQCEVVQFRIDRKVIARGHKLAAGDAGQKIYWQCHNGRPPLVITDDTYWDFDSTDADCIVQLGLFGDVIFG